MSTACRCPWLTGLRRTGSYTQRRLYPTRHPPHRSACLLHRSLLHSTPLHLPSSVLFSSYICILQLRVILKRLSFSGSEASPSPRRVPIQQPHKLLATWPAAATLIPAVSKPGACSTSMRQTRSPRPSPAAHAVLSVRATTRMAPCRGWCPHPTTTPSLRLAALDQTACKAGAKVLRLLRLPAMSDAVLQTKGRARRRTRRTCSVGNAKATCCLSSCSLRRDPCYAGTRSKSTLTLHRCTRM